MSKIEDKVIVKIKQRAEAGFKKYGTTMQRSDLTFNEWLTHLQEELMDACVYVERIMLLTDFYPHINSDVCWCPGPCRVHEKERDFDEMPLL